MAKTAPGTKAGSGPLRPELSALGMLMELSPALLVQFTSLSQPHFPFSSHP